MKRQDTEKMLEALQGLNIVSDRVRIFQHITEIAPFTTNIEFQMNSVSMSKKPKNRITVLYDFSNKVTGISYG